MTPRSRESSSTVDQGGLAMPVAAWRLAPQALRADCQRPNPSHHRLCSSPLLSVCLRHHPGPHPPGIRALPNLNSIYSNCPLQGRAWLLPPLYRQGTTAQREEGTCSKTNRASVAELGNEHGSPGSRAGTFSFNLLPPSSLVQWELWELSGAQELAGAQMELRCLLHRSRSSRTLKMLLQPYQGLPGSLQLVRAKL